MSQKFYAVVIALLTLFGGMMVWLFHSQGAVVDGMLKCLVSAGTWA